jgi:putative phosphoribosyl transferase
MGGKMKQGMEISIRAGGKVVHGDLNLGGPDSGVVLFAYGSGSSRFSSRERFVSDRLNEAGISTLFIDLLTEEEEAVDERTGKLRFDIPFLAERLSSAVIWAQKDSRTEKLKMGLFGGSTGASACLLTAAMHRDNVFAVVSRGGRTDLVDELIPKIKAATLFIVGGDDTEVLKLNRDSFRLLTCKEKKLEIIPGATHLFEEAGKLESVAELSVAWFREHLK